MFRSPFLAAVVFLLLHVLHVAANTPNPTPTSVRAIGARAGRAMITPPPIPHPHALRPRSTPDLLLDDPSACNIGLCAPSSYCTVFATSINASLPALGACCHSTASCYHRTGCVPYASHRYGEEGTVTNGVEYCPKSAGECLDDWWEFGYKTGVLRMNLCVEEGYGETTMLNPSWRWYEEAASTMTSASEGESRSSTVMEGTETEQSAVEKATTSASVEKEEPTETPQKQEGSSGDQLGVGATVGMAVGIIVAGGIVVGGILWVVLRQKRKMKAVAAVGMTRSLQSPPPMQQYWPPADQYWTRIAETQTWGTMVEVEGTTTPVGEMEGGDVVRRAELPNNQVRPEWPEEPKRSWLGLSIRRGSENSQGSGRTESSWR